MKSVRILLAVLVAAATAPLFAADVTPSSMEILRQKLKADKKLVVAANMDLTEAEAKAFWPVYDAYQKDLQAINERLKNAILSYAEAYGKGPVANETAKKLLTEALSIEDAELALKKAYVPKLEKAVPETKVARYIQIENKIRAAIKYELADGIPLVK